MWEVQVATRSILVAVVIGAMYTAGAVVAADTFDLIVDAPRSTLTFSGDIEGVPIEPQVGFLGTRGDVASYEGTLRVQFDPIAPTTITFPGSGTIAARPSGSWRPPHESPQPADYGLRADIGEPSPSQSAIRGSVLNVTSAPISLLAGPGPDTYRFAVPTMDLRWASSRLDYDLGSSGSGTKDFAGSGGSNASPSVATLTTAQRATFDLWKADVPVSFGGTTSLEGHSVNVQFDGRLVAGKAVLHEGVAPSASLEFRKGFDGSWPWLIPGFDHVALNFAGSIYESTPRDHGGEYYEGPTGPIRTLVADNGVQQQHTLGSFQHHSTTSTPGSGESASVNIDPFIAEKMVIAIESKMDTPYFTPYSLPLGDLLFLSSAAQKGAFDGTFSCVGLIEWAAEQAGLNDGHGFIPQYREDLPITPQRVYNYASEGLADVRVLEGFLDPVDFILTDPLGRRLGKTGATGVLNEIPDAHYSGEGEQEEFYVKNPLVGAYTLELFGINQDSFAIFGDDNVTSNFSGFLAGGEAMQLTLFVPEPPTFAIAVVAMIILALFHRRPQQSFADVRCGRSYSRAPA
jgi:hypothetical protein